MKPLLKALYIVDLYHLTLVMKHLLYRKGSLIIWSHRRVAIGRKNFEPQYGEHAMNLVMPSLLVATSCYIIQ